MKKIENGLHDLHSEYKRDEGHKDEEEKDDVKKFEPRSQTSSAVGGPKAPV